MSDKEREAIRRSIKDAREGVSRDLGRLDARLGEMKKSAGSKVPFVAAGVAAVGIAVAFVPRLIRRLFAKQGPAKGPGTASRKTSRKKSR